MFWLFNDDALAKEVRGVEMIMSGKWTVTERKIIIAYF